MTLGTTNWDRFVPSYVLLQQPNDNIIWNHFSIEKYHLRKRA